LGTFFLGNIVCFTLELSLTGDIIDCGNWPLFRESIAHCIPPENDDGN
jgi:hypothetical protein